MQAFQLLLILTAMLCLFGNARAVHTAYRDRRAVIRAGVNGAYRLTVNGGLRQEVVRGAMHLTIATLMVVTAHNLRHPEQYPDAIMYAVGLTTVSLLGSLQTRLDSRLRDRTAKALEDKAYAEALSRAAENKAGNPENPEDFNPQNL